MTSGRYIIGIDGGTEGIRASIVDLAGNELGFAIAPYPTDFPAPGMAEQQPQHWWQTLRKVVPQALADAGVSRDDVLAIGLDTTCCTVCLLDSNGAAIRPALLWMDVRSNAEAQRLMDESDPALRVNNGGHGPVSAEWMIPKALWVKTHAPDCYARATTICEYQDYLNFRLTGEMTASKINTAVRWHFQHDGAGAPLSLLKALGLEDLADKWPQRIVAPGDIVGMLTRRAAEDLSLRPGIPVVQGGADAFVAMAGLGVVRPGAVALVTGSSHLQLVVTETPISGRGMWGAYADVLRTGTSVVEGGQTSTGSVISWFRKTLAPDASYTELDDEAGRAPIGSEGLIAQDHFQGNRTPHTDALSRGAICGLSLNHSRGHIFRSLLESVGFGTRLILETMTGNGVETRNITACGGVTRSPLWTQIHADILGLPIRIAGAGSAPALGSAIYAAIGAEMFSNLDEAVGAMARIDRYVEPDAAAHRTYSEIFGQYRSLYGALKSIGDNRAQ